MVVESRWGSHGRGSQGTELLPNILSATCTADRIPSSWKPYPHHAPQNQTPPEPCNPSIVFCASIASLLNRGCARVT